ncbi:MAG: hypothetical protein HC905_02885 [Bacteroidales bacterium]|nr:hypothetical protein [Bacteroidales bacterium]
MYLIKEISELADELKEKYPKMTEFEALQIASKVQYNRILSDALFPHTNAPGTFEAIAIQMGYSHKLNAGTIPDALNEIAESIKG